MTRLIVKAEAGSVSVLDAAETGADLLTLGAGDAVEALEEPSVALAALKTAGTWIKVRVGEDGEGYLLADHLALPEDIPDLAEVESGVWRDIAPAGDGDAPDAAPEKTAVEKTPSPAQDAAAAAQDAAKPEKDEAAAKVITPSGGGKPSRIPVSVTIRSLNLRDAPDKGEIIGSGFKGRVLLSLESEAETQRKLGKEGEWLRLETLQGQEVYAAAWFLQAHDGPVPDSSVIPQARSIAGVNLDIFNPLGKPDVSRLGDMGWVRLKYDVSEDKGLLDLENSYNRHAPYLRQLKAAGYRVVMVFTHETWGEGRGYDWKQMNDDRWREFTGNYAPFLGKIAAQYADGDLIDVYQLWNEQDFDLNQMEAQVPLSPENYAYLLAHTLKAVKAANPQALVITGGHTAGPVAGPAYASKTIDIMRREHAVEPDGVAFHPYGRGLMASVSSDHPHYPYTRLGHIKESMQAYLAVMPGKPVWITEWGVLNAEGKLPPDEVLGYASRFINYLKDNYSGQIGAAIWYAWAMGMHNGYGLVGRDDQPLPDLYEGFIKL